MKLFLNYFLLFTCLGSHVFGSELPTHYPPTYQCDVKYTLLRELQKNMLTPKISTIFTTENIEVTPGKPVEVDLDDSNQFSVIFEINNDDNIYNNEKWTIRVMDKHTRKSLWCSNYIGHYLKRPIVFNDGRTGFINIVCDIHSDGLPEQFPPIEHQGAKSFKCSE